MTLLAVTLALWFAGWILLARLKKCGDGKYQTVSADQLSIIIPARNEEQNLPTLLDSITSQIVHPREIIVVDDSSTDRTAEIARKQPASVNITPEIRNAVKEAAEGRCSNIGGFISSAAKGFRLIGVTAALQDS